jgi:iron(III) transport system permease protein
LGDRLGTAVFRPRVGELLVNTALLVLLTVPITIVLAVALAWLTERSDLPGRPLWAWLCVAPLPVPAFVHSYAWITMVPGLHGLWAGVLVSVIAYFPFLYLPVSAALRRLDPGPGRRAAVTGPGPWRVFWRVVLPQLRLAICGGSLLVGLHLLAEYGLYVMIRFDTFTTAIVDQFQSTFNGPAANMLAGVLVLCCFVLLGLEVLVRGKERYARVGSGAARISNASWTRHGPCLLLPSSPRCWRSACRSSRWRAGCRRRRRLSGASTRSAWRLARPCSWRSPAHCCHRRRHADGLAVDPRARAGCSAAGGLQLHGRLAARRRGGAGAGHHHRAHRLPLYQTLFTVLLAYAADVPAARLVSLRAGIAQAPVELERAAPASAARPLRRCGDHDAAGGAGAAAGMALVALGITNELTATLMLAPNGTRTLATASGPTAARSTTPLRRPTPSSWCCCRCP